MLLPVVFSTRAPVPFLHVADFKGIRRGWDLRDTQSLEPGKVADLIILSTDPFHMPVNKIGETEVLVTMVGGKVVYQSALWTPR